MHSTVRFAEPPHQQHPGPDDGPAVQFRLPKISAASPEGHGVYNRRGYSPPSPRTEPAGYWKYPLPSKSFRLYVGPSLREPQPAAVAAQQASSQPASRGLAEADMSPIQLQRSRTEPVILNRAQLPQQQQQQLPAPYLPSRAQIFLRRQPPGLYREATLATAPPRQQQQDDEAERLRWTMSTQRHWQADRKGQQRNQGPFSREFTVHVTAPSSWMRMKWGRRLQQPAPDSSRPTDAPQSQFSYMYTKQAFGHSQQSTEF